MSHFDLVKFVTSICICLQWSSKVTILFLQDAQKVLDKLLEELLLSGHLPAIVAKVSNDM